VRDVEQATDAPGEVRETGPQTVWLNNQCYEVAYDEGDVVVLHRIIRSPRFTRG
jgi:hypothetical protein